MTQPSAVQSAQVDYALHTLGWKAFQDLCVAVAAEVLGRPVQVFLPSRDGGRDGAFVGTWDGAGDAPGTKSTIQCKFTSRADATLTLGDVASELDKVTSLATRGLAHDYIIITNAGVSGEADAAIVEAFEAAGATHCRVLGRDWLTGEIRTRPRLRMMVPRLYGLGDLSQIIDARAYAQARRILSSMGDDLACFVTTQAHRQSVEALNAHRFVLLLGDPASGKSTIGASLAIGALDDGAVGTVRVTSPEAFEQHWNPDEPNQFFWIDDAFGATQYRRGLTEGWNARLSALRAAVKNGARVLMTSRTYIWNAARRDLKSSEFPLFQNSQIIIDVQSLGKTERAQILYNHVKRGDQPKKTKRALKQFLPVVATSPGFLPETARRIGSTFFTGKLELSSAGIKAFVERPVDFLTEVLRGLDDAGQAAIALVFLHGAGGVPSPVPASPDLDIVCRLTGASAADVSRSLEALRGSLTLLLEGEDGARWVFKHPTIADAYAVLVAGSPELIEIYVRGAKRDRLLDEVVCGEARLQGASVRVPPMLYPALLQRLCEGDPLDRGVLSFLCYRGDTRLLKRFANEVPAVLDLAGRINSDLATCTEVVMLARLKGAGLLPEECRARAAKVIAELSIDNADGAAFSDSDVRELLSESELDELTARFKTEIVERYADDPLDWGSGVWSTDMPGHFRFLRQGLERYRDYVNEDEAMAERLDEAIGRLEDHIEEMERSDDDHHSELATPPVASADAGVASIFDDIDE